MYLESLNLINFRNLANQKIDFKEGVNVFWGENAQGKTNLLEALYLLASGKSFRTRIDSELINWGQSQARVTGKAGNLDIELALTGQNKELTINKQARRLTELIGSFVAVLFTPNDVELVSGPPSERRRYFDQLLSYLNKEYLYRLVSLNKVLKNRNQLLYHLRPGRESELDIWDEQLASLGSYIWQERLAIVEKLGVYLERLGKELLNSPLILEYNPIIKENVEKVYLEKLRESRFEDLRRKYTLYGPHRDNFKILLSLSEASVPEKDLGAFGSRGEQRASALALKLAEIEILRDEKEIQPVLLLDEVLSELDDQHRALLLNKINTGQTFVTSTSLEAVEKVLGKKVVGYYVEKGQVSLQS